MPTNITKAELDRLRKSARSALARAQRLKDKADEAVETVVQSMEVNGASFTFGVINGRWQGLEVLGIPAELLTGFAAHSFAGLIMDDPNAKHLHNLADGALSSYSTTLGYGIGKKWREEQMMAPTAAPTTPPASEESK